MSGFFSLGGDKDQEQDLHHHHNNNSLLLFKNQEIYNKGFELWQQYYQLHQQKQNQDQDLQDHVGFPSKRDVIDGDRESSDSRLRRRGIGGGDEEMNCQDCGNQAKKDCPHSRCRTCCKSRGFQCQTHVKSTWIPAAKRRERQHQLAGDNPKRLREVPSGGRAAVSSGFEVGPSFPPEVNSPAVFRCVKVSAIDDAEEHLAYQTAVNIGGHVFKGILYDQGPENRHPGGTAFSSGQQGLDLLNVPTHAAMIDHSVYPAPLTAFMAGTQFFPPPRP